MPPAPSASIPVIGVVGGVGAGKTTVAAAFEDLGCARIDADALGHAVLGEPPMRQFVRRRWGPDCLRADGSVDRTAVGRIVFADPAELVALNAVTHPRIRRRVVERIDAARRAGAPAVVLDAAVLFEAGWDDLCTHTVFVSASAEQRRRRARRRSGWSAAAWQAREKTQISLDKKAAACDYIIENDTTASDLRKRVRPLFDQIVRAPGRSR